MGPIIGYLKGKGTWIYIAPKMTSISSSRRSDNHSLTFKQRHACLQPSRSPDGAATDCGDNIKLQLTTYLSTLKG